MDMTHKITALLSAHWHTIRGKCFVRMCSSHLALVPLICVGLENNM